MCMGDNRLTHATRIMYILMLHLQTQTGEEALVKVSKNNALRILIGVSDLLEHFFNVQMFTYR